jgi:hypothetical protein
MKNELKKVEAFFIHQDLPAKTEKLRLSLPVLNENTNKPYFDFPCTVQ